MTRTVRSLLSSYLQRPWCGALLYAIFGLAWITGSDQLLAWLIEDLTLLTRYQSYKGYFYVALTAGLAWFLLSQKQHYAQSLDNTEQKLAATFAHAAVGIAHVALDGHFLRVNSVLCQMLGYDAEQLKHLTFRQLTHPADLAADEQAVQQLLQNKVQQYSLDKRYLRPDGGIVWARLSVALVRSAKAPYFISVVHDITQQRQIQQQLAQSELRFRTLLDNAPQLAIQGYQADGTTFYWNKACEQIYGYSQQEALGKNLLDLIIPSYMHEGVEQAMRQMASTGYAVPSEEMALRRKDGSLVPVYSGHAVVKLPDMEPQIFCIDLDLTAHKKQAAELAFLADYDPVTQLANRQFFMQQVKQALQPLTPQHSCAVMLLDLDNFKNINDCFGHSTGDELLRLVSQRLQRLCMPEHILARLGGDEFGILVRSAATSTTLERLGHDVLRQLQQPFTLSNQLELVSSVSVGVALWPEHAADAEGLLRAADAAMYEVKSQGRNNIAFYDDKLTVQAKQRLLIESRLRNAIAQGQLSCVYQPQLAVADNRIIGAEVLLRWHDDELGSVSPAVFIPLAEQSGLIHSLGYWVLEQCCRQISQWRAQGLPSFSLAVNVSAQQFANGRLLSQLTQVLADTGLPPHLLELEVTESALMADEDTVVETMRQIRALGTRLAIDDFGTGYSSLAYLKRLPLDVLKIDKRFIDHIPLQEDDKQIASAIIALAHNLNFKVLAEGVETAAQLQFLQQQGCDYYQGYYFSKPLSVDDFAALLASMPAA
ncbi:putative bifunctional diguanylate cyclase/phosphodiesterase [Rheinheimera sp.]|uniref:putative bifunctional diguanylate cyclase/phosphodiesterase n=1 Tax=Rheinheimera sp. TaxID=1869214 RepID=UPI0040478487